MKKNLFCLVILIVSVCGCSKNGSPSSPENHFNEIFQVSLTLDNRPISKVYPQDSINISQGYTRDQGNGNHFFGGGPAYMFANDAILEIQLGAAYGPVIANWDSAFASFVSLCAPGNKAYDVIGFAPQQETNRVEITYRDENGDYWCTSRIDASGTAGPKLAPGPVQQAGSTFVVTSEKKISFDNRKDNGVLIKGTFSCILYKFTTFEQKQVTNGSFVGVFGVI